MLLAKLGYERWSMGPAAERVLERTRCFNNRESPKQTTFNYDQSKGFIGVNSVSRIYYSYLRR